jgi:hypothetical protein
MKISSEHGFLFYAILSIICIIVSFPWFWLSYMCITGGEYWPLILFGGIIFGSWFAAYGFFVKREKLSGPKPTEIEFQMKANQNQIKGNIVYKSPN